MNSNRRVDGRLLIENNKQTFTVLDITLLWSGINICLPSFMLGGILVPDLSFMTALLVTVAGNLILALLIFLMGIPGVERGYSSVLLSRKTFGYPLGSFVPSLLVLISMIGWAAILLNLSGQAAAEIINQFSNIPTEKFFMIIIGLLMILSTLGGAKKMNYVNKFNVPALLVLTGWIAFVLLKNNTIREIISYQPSGGFTLVKALDLVVGGTIAGVFVSSDLSRYARKKSVLGIGVLAGTIPATIILAVLGMFSRLSTGSWNPVSVISSLGLGIPALLLIILSTWTTIQVSLYSGGLATANLIKKNGHKTGVIILGVVMILLALNGIINYFENWLVLLNNLFAPLIMITIINYFILPDLFPAKTREKKQESRNINLPAILSLGISLVLNQYFARVPLPLPAFLTSLLLTGLTYLIFSCLPLLLFKDDSVK